MVVGGSAIGSGPCVVAVGVGLVLGLLIVFPALLSDNLFCRWGTKLLMIQSGYRVMSVVLMSLALYFVR